MHTEADPYHSILCPKSRSKPVEFASNGSHVALSQHLLSFKLSRTSLLF